MKKIVIALITIGLFATACKKAPVATSTSNEQTTKSENDLVLITFAKSPCFGTCPYYSATILPDGTVNFNGIKHTDLIGEHKLKASSSFAEEVYKRAKEINFFELNDEYDNKSVMDIPATTLTIQTKDVNKAVMARWETPKELGELNEYVHTEILRLVKSKKAESKKKIPVLNENRKYVEPAPAVR